MQCTHTHTHTPAAFAPSAAGGASHDAPPAPSAAAGWASLQGWGPQHPHCVACAALPRGGCGGGGVLVWWRSPSLHRWLQQLAQQSVCVVHQSGEQISENQQGGIDKVQKLNPVSCPCVLRSKGA
eukprot:1159999-Pelagomonas_calceolata.AAC.10